MSAAPCSNELIDMSNDGPSIATITIVVLTRSFGLQRFRPQLFQYETSHSTAEVRWRVLALRFGATRVQKLNARRRL